MNWPSAAITLLFATLFGACAAPSQDALDKMRAEHDAEMTAFKDEIRAELAKLEEAVEGLSETQTKLAAKQRELGDSAPTPARPSRPDPEVVYSVPVGDAAVRGPEQAWVTVVEISDFQCPFCSRAQQTLERVRKEYGDDVRVVFKHNPLAFHKQAMPAAIAAECAGEQGQFWAMHDVMFENQRALEDTDLDRYAAGLNLNIRRWRKCVKEQRHKDKIASDQRFAVSIGARGTPTFYINGRVLTGAQPFPAFDALIAAELEKAKASGLPKADYYEKAVVDKGRKEM